MQAPEASPGSVEAMSEIEELEPLVRDQGPQVFVRGHNFEWESGLAYRDFQMLHIVNQDAV